MREPNERSWWERSTCKNLILEGWERTIWESLIVKGCSTMKCKLFADELRKTTLEDELFMGMFIQIIL